MAEVSEHHLMLVQLDLIKVALSAILNVRPAIPVLVQSAGRIALLVGMILEPNVKRSLMAEQLVSPSMFVLQELTNLVLFAIQIASQVTTESDQFAGNPAHLVGLISVLSAVFQLISTAKVAAAQFSVAVVVPLVILMMVALAEDQAKLWLRVAMVMELDPQWVAQATKILMVDSVIQNVKLVTLESVQSAGKLALRAILILEQPA